MRIVGAKEHNLRNLSLDLPRDQFIVVTGLSGSGKSTLAFDIVYAEGQRRYLDSLSTYARQFVKILPRPNVDLLAGVPPTVAIEQRLSRGSKKSTVATVTEIYHYLRLLYAKIGVQHCTGCGQRAQLARPASRSSTASRRELRGAERHAAGPAVRGRKGIYTRALPGGAQARLHARRASTASSSPLSPTAEPGALQGARHRHRRRRGRARRAAAAARLPELVATALRARQRRASIAHGGRRRAHLQRAPVLRAAAASATRRSTRACSPSTAARAPARPATASAAMPTFEPELLIGDPQTPARRGAARRRSTPAAPGARRRAVKQVGEAPSRAAGERPLAKLTARAAAARCSTATARPAWSRALQRAAGRGRRRRPPGSAPC